MSTKSGVVGLRVKGTAYEISQSFDDLVGLGATVLELQVSDYGNIALTANQQSAGSDLLDRVVGAHGIQTI